MPTDPIVATLADVEDKSFVDRFMSPHIQRFEEAAKPPQIVMNGDKARAGRNDPETSHRAADRSQKNLHETREAVLKLVAIHEPVTGSGINEQYSVLAGRPGYPDVHPDSPRKRAGELAEDGLLTVTRDKRGTEGVYRLTDAGRKAVGR